MSDYDSVNDEYCMCRKREAVAEGGVGGCGERIVCWAEGGVIRRPAGPKLGHSASHWLPLACLSLIWRFGNGKIITSLHKVMSYLPMAPEHTTYTPHTHTSHITTGFLSCSNFVSAETAAALTLLQCNYCINLSASLHYLAFYFRSAAWIFIYTVYLKMSFLVYACLCFFLSVRNWFYFMKDICAYTAAQLKKANAALFACEKGATVSVRVTYGSCGLTPQGWSSIGWLD